MAFKLDTFKDYENQLDKGREIDILDPATGEATGFKVVVASYESKRVKDAVRRLSEERRKRGRGSKEASVEEMEEMTMAVACAAVLAWSGYESAKGVAVPCDADNVREVLDASSAIRKQIDTAANDETAFFIK